MRVQVLTLERGLGVTGHGIRTLDGCNPITVFKPAAILGGPVLRTP
jgi:hypothetical protein